MIKISLPVTALSSYLYCPRKLYLNRVRGFKEPLNEAIVIGQAYHEVLETVCNTERELVSTILETTSHEEIFLKYKTKFYTALVTAITKRRNMIKKTKSNSLQLFQDLWQQFLLKAETRAEILINFIESEKVYGENLWEKLTPKIITEQWVAAPELQIHGRVDQIEQHSNEKIPIEIKSTMAPEEGIWENHKVQLAAYMMILKSKEGYMEYKDGRRKLILDPEIETEINSLIQEVKEMLQKPEPPEINENKNKCAKCGIRNECFNAVSYVHFS